MTTEDQHQLQVGIDEFERLQRRQRQRIVEVEDVIKEKRDRLITALERRLNRSTTRKAVFMVRWSVW